jgi:alkylhydroperoxidase/carboxymuconolactone decarboxylase family protein YurZ
MQSKNPFAILQKESPQVSKAFTNLITAVSAGGPDAKTRQLIFIGIKASQGDASAVAAHVPMAKSEGASRDEVLGTILMTLPVSGIQGITNCLIPALEAYERKDEAI